MIVIATSRCKGKSINRTRCILDSYGIAIGDGTWSMILTPQGVQEVVRELRATASKNTSVALFRDRQNRRPELIKIVGNKKRFDAQGNAVLKHVPVTPKAERPFAMRPLLQAILTMAGLTHDLGKNTVTFSTMLRSEGKNFKPDGIRHEVVSTHLMQLTVGAGLSIDEAFDALKRGSLAVKSKVPSLSLNTPLGLSAAVVLTHHRMLGGEISNTTLIQTLDRHRNDNASLVADADLSPVLANYPRYDSDLAQRLIGKVGKAVAGLDHVTRLQDLGAEATKTMDAKASVAIPALYTHARAAFMMADHYYSSLDTQNPAHQAYMVGLHKSDPAQVAKDGVYANKKMRNGVAELDQGLEDHLLGVASNTEPALNALEYLRHHAPGFDAQSLTLPDDSPARFQWQNRAVATTLSAKATNPGAGVFSLINASTGAGKTAAAVRIGAAAYDGDEARLTFASPLRIVTRQARDDIAERCMIDPNDLGLAVGGISLDGTKTDDGAYKADAKHLGSDMDAEDDLETYVDDSAEINNELPGLVTRFIGKSRHASSFIRVPCLICTIDYINKAFEPVRGNHLLAYMRVISSDIIIDEADDYPHAVSLRIARMAGLAGRNLHLITATMYWKSAAEIYKAYRDGLAAFQAMRGLEQKSTALLLADQDQEAIFNAESVEEQVRTNFLRRAARLADQPTYRRGYIRDIECAGAGESKRAQRIKATFDAMIEEIYSLHSRHAVKNGNKALSVGACRFEKINDMAAFAQYFANKHREDGKPPVFFMLNHGRFTNGERAYKNRKYKQLLSFRAGKQDGVWQDPDVMHLMAKHPEAIIVMLTTAAGERGTNWDFDWLITEPISIESLIQLVGRVNRHRQKEIDAANVCVLRFPINDGSGFTTDIHHTAMGGDILHKISQQVLEKIDARALLGDESMQDDLFVQCATARLSNDQGFFGHLEASQTNGHNGLTMEALYTNPPLRIHHKQEVYAVTVDGKMTDPNADTGQQVATAPKYNEALDKLLAPFMFGLWRRKDIYEIIDGDETLTDYQKSVARQINFEVFQSNNGVVNQNVEYAFCDALGVYDPNKVG